MENDYVPHQQNHFVSIITFIRARQHVQGANG